MKTIKTRNTVRGIKALNKSVNLSKRMKNSIVRTKEIAEETRESRHTTPSDYAVDSIQDKTRTVAKESIHHLPNPRQKASENWSRAKGHFQEIKRQGSKEQKKVTEQTQKTAHQAKTVAGQAGESAREAKSAVTDTKQSLQEIQQSGQQVVHEALATSRPGYLNRGVRASNSAGNMIEASANSATAIKKNVKTTSKGTVKTTKKTVKTAEQSAKATVKTARQTAKTAQKTAQETAKAEKVAEKAARAAAKAAERMTKATARAVSAMVKATIAAVKGLIAAIAAGGWVAVVIILVICLIGLLVGSVFGIFFSSEPDPNTGQTINSVIAEIDADYTSRIDGIISSNSYDLLDISGMRAAWKQVLAVYTVKTVTDQDNPMEVATMTDEKAGILQLVFWDMNTITHTLDAIDSQEDVLGDDGLPTGETTTITKTVLCITVAHKTADEMAAQYGFDDEKVAWLQELLKPEYHYLWNALLYGISSVGDGSMLEVAETQIGNIGGQPYWSWYGFTCRVEWCACFVSWCAEQCGYIDAGILPRFSACSDGIRWFKDRDQWQDSGYTPASGDIIFFDWGGDGVSDHVGIVECVSDGKVHTIEGNTSDSCARRSYDLGSGKIFGYGVPVYSGQA